jgi:hypothetical protein
LGAQVAIRAATPPESRAIGTGPDRVRSILQILNGTHPPAMEEFVVRGSEPHISHIGSGSVNAAPEPEQRARNSQ